jgi:hypothetical protein
MSQVQPGQGKPGIARWECLKKKMAKIKTEQKDCISFLSFASLSLLDENDKTRQT